jgi:NAD(P)-dependent dehydrogenase (short-subunit alcohol dehydrogenase family)
LRKKPRDLRRVADVCLEGGSFAALGLDLLHHVLRGSGGLPNRARDLAPQVPMQRPGTADEVAQSIAWLLSGAASYVTGSIIDVAGGR